MRSGWERKVADYLARHGVKYKYESRKIKYKTPIKSASCGDCASRRVYQERTYLVDFDCGGTILETKGYLNSRGRTKLLGIIASNPNLDLRVVFQADNKISKNSETRYSDWCEEKEITYCIGLPPTEWFRALGVQDK